MGNEQGGFALPGGAEVVQNGFFRLGIHRRHGIVQNQDGGIHHQGPGNGNPLLLTAGDGDAPFTQHRVVAQGEIPDVGVHGSQGGGFGNGRHGLFIHTEADVVGDGVGEQEILLGHIGTPCPHITDGDGVHVPSVNKHRAVRYIVSTHQKVCNGGLAGAGFAHQTDVFPGLDGKGHIFQGVKLPVRVPEGKILKFNVTPDVLHAYHIGTVYHVRLGVQQLADTL